MDYELFKASAVKAFGHCLDIKAMVSDIQQVLSAVPGMVRENECLEKEKAELKAEIERLKSEVPGDCMKLPVDADGVPIEVGEVVYCFDKESGEPKAGFGPFRVIDYDPHAQAVLLRYEKGGVDRYGNYSESFESCELLTHRKPDSWEKLEEDSLKDPCTYFGKLEDQSVSCLACPHGHNTTGRNCGKNMKLDLIERAKKLAGIEEQEGE